MQAASISVSAAFRNQTPAIETQWPIAAVK
jgi:hypothetical protein